MTDVPTRQAVAQWIDAWARGWATHDVELVASAYADDAVHRSAPFREPQRTADYAVWAFSDEKEAEVWFAEPLIDGDRATIPWWAVSRGTDGRDTTLAGASVVRFRTDGRVAEQWDYWNRAADIALPPPVGWGPVTAHEGGPG